MSESTDALDRWLRILTERGAADLFLVAGFAPSIRLNGIVTPLSEGPLDGDDIEAAVVPSLHAQALKSYRATGSADISLHITITRKNGSFTLEESLANLVHRGLLTAEDARTRTIHLEELDSLLRGRKTTL